MGEEVQIANLILMAACGLVGHHVLILGQLTAERGHVVSPLAYIRERPYRATLSLIGTIAGFLILQESGQLSMVTAFGIGFMGDSLAHRAGAIAEARLQ